MIPFQIPFSELIKDLPILLKWLAVFLIVIFTAITFYWKSKKKDKPLSLKIIIFGAILSAIFAVIALSTIIIWPWQKFKNNQSGVIILQLCGDDKDNSLRRHLIASLNEELKLEGIIIKGIDKTVDEEKLGKEKAHAQARQIGTRYNAILALWGDVINDNKFHPRLTVIQEHPDTVNPDSTLQMQDIKEMQLPAILIETPISLAYFLSGYNN